MLVNKLLEVHETDTLVDIGCGGGGRIDALSTSCFCVGTDVSEKTCRTTRKQAKQSEVVRADMDRLPLKDASVDKVAAVYSMVYASDKRIVFNEIAWILKNNGVLVVYEPNRWSTRTAFRYLQRITLVLLGRTNPAKYIHHAAVTTHSLNYFDYKEIGKDFDLQPV
ncbi:MAG: class I SAM-dependent methyltransferase [Methanobacteriota archaeon]|nr:MAG: class I SAM-dependent methyltransferase [Euryarchaeota archaeon]